jgi:3-hydroxyisobutyrate dehydrogenase-like beta-hydroxyacid dehydrogenase
MELRIIGLGAMEEPMAQNLIKAGHTMKVYLHARKHARVTRNRTVGLGSDRRNEIRAEGLK